MKIIRVLFVLAVMFFISPYYYSIDGSFTSEGCFSDQTGIAIFEPFFVSKGADFLYAHGGGLNKCVCHFNRKTSECHCHRDKGCRCECQPSGCE